jgi:hypothetical protein
MKKNILNIISEMAETYIRKRKGKYNSNADNVLQGTGEKRSDMCEENAKGPVTSRKFIYSFVVYLRTLPVTLKCFSTGGTRHTAMSSWSATQNLRT